MSPGNRAADHMLGIIDQRVSAHPGGFTPRTPPRAWLTAVLDWMFASKPAPGRCITHSCNNYPVPGGALCVPCCKAQEVYRLVIKWQECQCGAAARARGDTPQACGCTLNLYAVKVPRNPAGCH